MARSRVEFRVPPGEKLALKTSAAGYGLSVSLYLRALALEDREEQERERMLKAMYPQKVRTEQE